MRLFLSTILSFCFLLSNCQVYIKAVKPVYVVGDALPPPPSFFTFSLDTSSITSAGIYSSNGVLQRTLWSNERKPAGVNAAKWDGTNDAIQPLPDETYKAKILSSNVKYTWQGVIGNTSDSLTGSTLHRGLDFMSNMVAVGSKLYATLGYGEGATSIITMDTTAPNKRVEILPFANGSGIDAEYIATDSNYVYVAGCDPYDIKNNFVVAVKVSDNSEVTFSSGIRDTTKKGVVYKSTIARDNTSNETSSGMAVMKDGNYLFVAHGILDKISVYNKSTGAFVRNITTFDNPRRITIDRNDNIWIIHGTNNLQKFSIENDGTLTNAVASITGLTQPLAIGISPDNSIVRITDGGTSQQVKDYTNSGEYVSTYGIAGGYMNAPSVLNNKFYFDDDNGVTNAISTNPVKNPFVAFQSDGSCWISDPGNYRIQHFNTEWNVINRIEFFGRLYSTYVDFNNATRVFAEYLEFDVDYSLPIDNGKNGSWILKRNWRRNVPAAYFDGGKGLMQVSTLSNGRTYGLRINNVTARHRIIELDTITGFRVTNVDFGTIGSGVRTMNAEGSIMLVTNTNPQKWVRRNITGFVSNNPVYGAADTIATGPGNPLLGGARTISTFPNQSGIIPVYQGAKTGGYHLGGLIPGANTFAWKAQRSTHSEYTGPMPGPDRFDIGNYQPKNGLPGSVALGIERSFFTGYYGEFWKNGQANIFNHYYDNGLAIGQFGTVKNGQDGQAGMAGNAFSPAIVKVGSDYYLYHNDEAVHGGIHRWKISGLNTIKIDSVVLTPSFARTSEKSAIVGLDLLAGLPFNSVVANGTAGWTRYPATDNGTTWTVTTNKKIYNERLSPDIGVSNKNKTEVRYLQRDLGNNLLLTDWELKGKINFEGNGPNASANGMLMYVELLDNADKVLVRLDNVLVSTGVIKFYVNNTKSGSNDIEDGVLIGDVSTSMGSSIAKDISIKYASGICTVTYGSFNPVTVTALQSGANIAIPSKFRVNFVLNGNGTLNDQLKQVGFKQLKFIK
jgi:hypothetical protein